MERTSQVVVILSFLCSPLLPFFCCSSPICQSANPKYKFLTPITFFPSRQPAQGSADHSPLTAAGASCRSPCLLLRACSQPVLSTKAEGLFYEVNQIIRLLCLKLVWLPSHSEQKSKCSPGCKAPGPFLHYPISSCFPLVQIFAVAQTRQTSSCLRAQDPASLLPRMLSL